MCTCMQVDIYTNKQMDKLKEGGKRKRKRKRKKNRKKKKKRMKKSK